MNSPTLVTSSPDEMMEPLMTAEEAAKYLGVSTAYIKDHCTRSRPFIPHSDLGTKKKAMRRFRRSDLQGFANQLRRAR